LALDHEKFDEHTPLAFAAHDEFRLPNDQIQRERRVESRPNLDRFDNSVASKGHDDQ